MIRPIILTMGDPTGVGPELIVKALFGGAFDQAAHPLLVAGDPAVLQRAAALFGVSVSIEPGEGLASHRLRFGERLLAVASLSRLDAGNLAYG
ncbi:MAG TPA: 4-hydroxythreonine-4-phosphate dehydrogenase, partial [Desulfuromonadales bacterium]|nr:4-hydroxythreonine-4-phosphate dehydrogenase [Desulfuromonadales bacterium]